MPRAAIEQTVRTLLTEKNYGGFLPVVFDAGSSLLEAGVIDSFGLFAFIADLETAFAITVARREIHPGNFETIDSICAFICTKIKS